MGHDEKEIKGRRGFHKNLMKEPEIIIKGEVCVRETHTHT